MIRANKIIDEILGFGRERDLVLKKCSCNQLLQEVVDLQKIDSKIKVHKHFDPQVEESVIDSDHISQAFTNLVRNAVESMEDHGGTLTLETKLMGDRVEIKFKDTGCGISKENLDKIFEPLFTTKLSGTGLGMPTVKNVVERHQGKIKVESAVNSGTTVTLSIPYLLTISESTSS